MVQANGTKVNECPADFHLYCSPKLPLPVKLWSAGAYVSHLIHYATSVKPHDWADLSDGIPLSNKRLRKVLGGRADPVLKMMRERGVIKRSKGYRVGENPFHYTLKPPYDTCMRLSCSDRRLVNRIVQQARERHWIIRGLERNLRYLEIDPAASAASLSLPPRDDTTDLQGFRENASRCVQLIRSGDSMLMQDHRHGRVFSAHTALPRELRKYLRSATGEAIVSLDVRNCQPLLLALVFAQFYGSPTKRRHRLLTHRFQVSRNPYLWPTLRTVSDPLRQLRRTESDLEITYKHRGFRRFLRHIEETGAPPVRSCAPSDRARTNRGNSGETRGCSGTGEYQGGVGVDVSPSAQRAWKPQKGGTNDEQGACAGSASVSCGSDLRKGGESQALGSLPMSCWEWLELAESGRLYEHFGGDREQVKQEFIYLMFGRRPLCSFPVGRQIQAEFLEVAEAIEALKRRNILAKNDDPRPYRYMACLLQLYESTLMIYRVCGRILKERPDVPIWTVHDCVMTEQRHKEYVKGIILEEFAFVGIVPSIKEDWL